MERVSESPNPRVMCPFIHHSTRVPIAVRINSPLAGLAPHPIPYPPWLQISTSNLLTYWAALFPSVAGESHKIQAFRPSSRFVPLERPLSFSCSPFAMGEHFSSAGKRDITSCTHCFIPHLGLTQIVFFCKGLCVDDTEFRTMISDPSMSLILPPDSPRRIRRQCRIDCEMRRQSTN
jgi:hypothetical protein